MEYKKITTCITSFNLWSKQEDDSHALSHIPKNSWTIVYVFAFEYCIWHFVVKSFYLAKNVVFFTSLRERMDECKEWWEKKQSKRSDL